LSASGVALGWGEEGYRRTILCPWATRRTPCEPLEASLTSTELSGAVDLLLASSTQEQTSFVWSDPRRAMRQADDRFVHHWDPRLVTIRKGRPVNPLDRLYLLAWEELDLLPQA